MNRRTALAALRVGLAVAVLAILSATIGAQDRLKTMPGYDQYQRMNSQIRGAFEIAATSAGSGAVAVRWNEDSASFDYTKGGKIYRFDVATKQATDVGPAPEPAAGERGARGGVPPVAGQTPPAGRGQQTPPAGRGGAPERGRQVAVTASPDGQLTAFHYPEDRNLYIIATATLPRDQNGAIVLREAVKNATAVTTDGSVRDRIKNGTASWVYGEELNQTTAMWWSPDGKKLAYYRFDEKPVPDYHLQLEQTRLYSRVDTEAYPKAGQPNPIVELFVYDVAARKSVKVDVRDGKPFDNAGVGHYVYRIHWSPDGRELLFNRTNRRQNILEFVAAHPDTGATRVVLREEWPTGWVENNPPLTFLKDGRRFIWQSERNGWKNYYLYDLSGKLLNPITTYSTFEAGGLVKIDEARGVVFLMARDGDNFLKLQLHRVGLDGKGDTRLTDPKFNHTISGCITSPALGGGGRGAGGQGGGGGNCAISPDNRFVVDVYQTHNIPPATRLIDAGGKVMAELASSDMTTYDKIGFKKAEMFTYLAADGKTVLRGIINFPSNFDPNKKYPALASVYGGPASASSSETFRGPNATTEYGFLVLGLDSRAVPGMGKRSLDSVYLKLGQTEMDDMAEGVKALWSRPYFDRERVGIYGTSYGGYSAAMCVLRHPEVFRAGSASSAVTSWVHYDSIYTERYMWIPEENKEGYEKGSAMTYADKLNGRLLIYYGTADNNVHPTNSMQLIRALQQAGKSFEVMVGPDAGHSGVNQQRMMEFFIENLVINKPPVPPRQ